MLTCVPVFRSHASVVNLRKGVRERVQGRIRRKELQRFPASFGWSAPLVKGFSPKSIARWCQPHRARRLASRPSANYIILVLTQEDARSHRAEDPTRLATKGIDQSKTQPSFQPQCRLHMALVTGEVWWEACESTHFFVLFLLWLVTWLDTSCLKCWMEHGQPHQTKM